jgi:catechol 2,3-dioxygenase-like lactoylglutathione lyase family enzyme
MMRVLAFLAGLLIATPLAHSAAKIEAVSHVVIPVSDLRNAAAFYTSALSFVPSDAAKPPAIVLRLGCESIELVPRHGRPIPANSRSNDRWFQHLAIVVSDIEQAYEIARRSGAVPISAEPQRLPDWNSQAAGIRAVYFRDPDGHPLELIQYPAGKGEVRWQQKDRLFLGIDHTAIAAGDTAASLAFYHDRLGLRIAGQSENWGVEQEQLSAVPAAHLRITTLRGESGPGIELLHYLMPRNGRPMPADSGPDDLWSDEIVLIADGSTITGERLRDPDGHVVRINADEETSR